MWRAISKIRDKLARVARLFTFDKLINTVIIAAFITLLVLVWFYVRPIQTVDIKVPVATDRSSYYPGQKISGIFFGEVYYTGQVEVLREVYCKDFKQIIKTDEGDQIFKGVSRPLKLDGASRYVGHLPTDIPVGSNCVVQFVNTYHVSNPFGTREISVVYYTQNFAIISKTKYDTLQCELAIGDDYRWNEQ